MTEEEPNSQPIKPVPSEDKKSIIGKIIDGYIFFAQTIFLGVKGSHDPDPRKKKDTPSPSGGKPQTKPTAAPVGFIDKLLGNTQKEPLYDHSAFYEKFLKLTLEFYDENGNQYDVKESFPKNGSKVRIDEPTGNYIIIRFTEVKIEEKELPLG